MPRRIELEHQRDFTGGLNLADDPYNLAPNESFDLQNVDIDRRGGFGLRRGSQKFIAQTTRRLVTATSAARAGNVVTVSGLSPVNGDPDGLTVGQQVVVTGFALGAGGTDFNGTFIVTVAAGGGNTAQWAQTAANDTVATGGTITGGLSNIDSGYTYVDTSGVRHILVASGGRVLRWDGASWQHVRAAFGAGRTTFIEYGNVLYFTDVGLVSVPFEWSGSGAAVQLTGTAGGNFNDDLTAPNGGNMPHCRLLAVHHEVVWAACVRETGPIDHECRVRWSHPLAAEDWRENDFIDLDPDDENGTIKALVPFGDRLLVFKDKAVYAIHGYPPAGFTAENLTKDLGCPSVNAVVATPDAVYFWDIDRGVYKYDGKGFEWVFSPLFPLIDDGKINMAFSFQVILAYHRDRLYVSVPYQDPPYTNTFVGLVYAPYAGKNGAWTLHTRTLFGWWVHRSSAGGDEHLVGGFGRWLFELDVEGSFEDQAGTDAGAQAGIVAHYATRWFDAGNPAMKKRWKRPVVIMRGGSNQTTVVEVLTDYDPTKVDKSFQLITTLDDTELVWDVLDWDEANWAREVTISGDRSVILKGAPLSGGTSKALRFRNTTQGQDWRVHGVTMKWIPRNIRN